MRWRGRGRIGQDEDDLICWWLRGMGGRGVEFGKRQMAFVGVLEVRFCLVRKKG